MKLALGKNLGPSIQSDVTHCLEDIIATNEVLMERISIGDKVTDSI